MKKIFFLLAATLGVIKITVMVSGCAQVMSPTGGPKDTIPPRLISAVPGLRTTNFKGDKITLSFDEYVQLDQVTQNLLVSPTPKKNPYVDYKLKTVIIKLKDTLMPNTTYVIDLGNSIKDLNEGNVYQNFSYVFSTGSVIDSLQISGKVLMAETTQADSTLQVYLYKNLVDSSVEKFKPDYIARVSSSGNFKFTNLAKGAYNIYALKDLNGSKTYDNPAEIFAFADSAINVDLNAFPITLYAYAQEPEKPKQNALTPAKSKPETATPLTFTTKINSENQSLLKPLILDFGKPLKTFDKNKIRLTDTSGISVSNVSVSLDTTFKQIIIDTKWKEDFNYVLIINKDLAADSIGNILAKSDTIKFKTKKIADYGSIKITFSNLNKIKNPLLQFVNNNAVIYSYPLTGTLWAATLFEPGDYELRILSDENKNGIWDPGNFKLKKQPERVISISQKLNIKANWDNEREIQL